MKIAIIDDGIYEENIYVLNNVEHYKVLSDLRIIKSQKAPVQNFTHGTFCAAIFNEIYPDSPNTIIDISVLDRSGKATINGLVTALEWCLKNSVKLVHMSLGTVNFYDIAILKNIIDLLLNKGTILVSAFHSKYLRSYPAAFPGVFGVRHSIKENRLRNGEFALDMCKGLSTENCFIAKYNKSFYIFEDTEIEIGHSNSFTAPVLTGYIAKYINENQNAVFPEVLEYLLKNCSKIEGHAPKIEPYLKNRNYNNKKPVVFFLSEDKSVFYELLETLNKTGFSVTALSEKGKDTIPIPHYLNKSEKISSNLLFTIEYIYDPDIILLCVDKNRMNLPIDWEIIDAFVKKDKFEFCMMLEDKAIQFKTPEALFQGLISYFQANID